MQQLARKGRAGWRASEMPERDRDVWRPRVEHGSGLVSDFHLWPVLCMNWKSAALLTVIARARVWKARMERAAECATEKVS